MTMLPSGLQDGFPVDAHVHFHGVRRVVPTVEAAARNFASLTSGKQPLMGAMLLVESGREQVFDRLLALDGGTLDGWRFERVPADPVALIATSGERRLLIVSGRQIRCEQGLEVLAYGTLDRFPEGEPISRTLERVSATDALVAVPWGFGKWMGQRGRVIDGLLHTADSGQLFLGDNGGRVRRLPEPRLLREGRARGFRVLPGSDPFPLGGDERRVGAFGFVAQIEPSPEHPWSDLRDWLRTRTGSPPAYGTGIGTARFLLNQIAIQIHNRRATGAAA